MPMPRPATAALLSSLLLAPAALCQGVMPLSGVYRFVNLAPHFGGPCAQSGPATVLDRGTITFQANGAFAMVTNVRDVCVGGTVQITTETGNGLYTVGTDGVLALDFDPLNPGTDVARLDLRGDGSVGVHARDSLDEESAMAVLIRPGSGMTNASLNGGYHVVRQRYTVDTSGLWSTVDLGVVTFDGLGAFTENGTRRTVLASGATSSAPYTASGTYAVAADGALTIGSGSGAVSPDGEILTAGTPNGATQIMMVAVRAGSGLGAADLAGDWGVSFAGTDHQGGGLSNQSGRLRLGMAATGASAGTYGGTGIEIRAAGPMNVTLHNVVSGGTFTLTPDGRVAAVESSSPGGPPLPLRLSAAGTFLIGSSDAAGMAEMIVAVRRCPWPQAYGSGTAGSGGQVPVLETRGGFPMPGNAGFGFAVQNCVGAGFAVVAFSSAPWPGVPLFGGTVWIDTNAMFGTVGLGLGGAPGAPGAGSAMFGLGLPNTPVFRSARFYLQTIVLDLGVAHNFAFSRGLDLQLGR